MGLRRLSDRELLVLQLIGSGSTAAEISVRLGITPKTVDAHRTHIKKKLGVKSASELLRYAVRALELGGVPRPVPS